MDTVKLILMGLGILVLAVILFAGIGSILGFIDSKPLAAKKEKRKKSTANEESADSIYLSPPVKKILRFSKKCLLYSFIAVGLFTVATIILHNTAVGVPDTLITEFIGFFKIEGGILGGIKITETIMDKIFDILLSKKGDK